MSQCHISVEAIGEAERFFLPWVVFFKKHKVIENQQEKDEHGPIENTVNL